MLAITAQELTDARAEFEQLMTSSATIERISGQDDGQGGQTPTPVTLGPFPCRVVDLRVNRPLEFPHEQVFDAVMTFQIIFPHGTDVGPKDRITVDGNIYEVIQDNGVRTDNLLVMTNVVLVNQ